MKKSLNLQAVLRSFTNKDGMTINYVRYYTTLLINGAERHIELVPKDKTARGILSDYIKSFSEVNI